MNTLHSSLQDYLALRRGLGFKMSDAGRMLPGFVAFLEARHESYITAQSALDRSGALTVDGQLEFASRKPSQFRAATRGPTQSTWASWTCPGHGWRPQAS